MKNKGLWIFLAAVAVILVWGISSYNGFVNRSEQIDNAWSQVENQYQRRLDLIPNLINTVKGYAAHESQTFKDVIMARSQVAQITMGSNTLSAEQLAKYNEAQNAVGSALGRLMAVAEAYPELKASNNFMELQAQLEGTENRIAVARKDFNNAVKAYNIKTKRFPSNLIASMFGFETKAYFEATQGAATAPVVQF